jgi:hypothetical protein
VSVADRAGFSVTIEELQALQWPPTVELSDEELEGVTRGPHSISKQAAYGKE